MTATHRNHIFITGRNRIISTSSSSEAKSPLSEILLSNFKSLEEHRIKFMLSGIYHNFLVTENEEIFVFGGNHFGQLGLSHKEDKNVLTKWKHRLPSSDMPMTHISGRACFVGLVLDKRDIYLFGLNNFGQLGVGHQENLDRPTLLRIDPSRLRRGQEVDRSIGETQETEYTGTTVDGREVRILCCAGVHTICVLGDNECWVCGYNTYGQLGIGTKEDTYRPQRLTFFEEKGLVIKDVVCGDYHSIFLTEDQVFTCGKNGSGQLGLNCTSSRTVPEEILFFRGKTVTHISCGENHTIVIVDEREVYGFGTNTRGQLGLDTSTHEIAPTPIPIPTTNRIKLLQCGRNFTILVTVNDEVIVFGDNTSDQLGFDNVAHKYIRTPRIMPFPKSQYNYPIINVSCGEYHAMFLVSNIPPPQKDTSIDALRNMLTNYDEDKHAHLFDGEIICTDKTVKVFQGLVKKRCFPFFHTSSGSPKTYTVNFDSEVLSVILHYVYIDRLPDRMYSQDNTDSITVNKVITLYSWLEDNGGPSTLCSLLLKYLVDRVNDNTAASMLIQLDKSSKIQTNKLRRHLLAYLKSKVDQNDFDHIHDNDKLSQSLLREILTRGGKETLLNNVSTHTGNDLKVDMETLLYDVDEGDITVIVGPNPNDRLRVHKSILAFGVNKYMAQFTSGMKDQSITEIDLFGEFIGSRGNDQLESCPSSQSEAPTNHMTKEEEEDLTQLLHQFIKFLYTGTLEITATNAVSVINLWDHMSIPVEHPQYVACIKVITNCVDEGNVMEILKLFLPEKSHIFPDLEKKCISVCAQNWRKINNTYGDEIMNYISYSQYIAITRKFMDRCIEM